MIPVSSPVCAEDGRRHDPTPAQFAIVTSRSWTDVAGCRQGAVCACLTIACVKACTNGAPAVIRFVRVM